MEKVSAGQKFIPNAMDFNKLADVVNGTNRDTGSIPSDLRRDCLVDVFNDSGVDGNMFDVMKITGVVITPSDNIQEFNHNLHYIIDTVDADNDERMVVLQEPIAAGAIGKAMMVGSTQVMLVRQSGDTSNYCGPVNGQTYLQGANTGALILWEDTFTGTTPHLAVVKIPFTVSASAVASFAYNIVFVMNPADITGPNRFIQTLGGTATLAPYAIVGYHNTSTSGYTATPVLASSGSDKPHFKIRNATTTLIENVLASGAFAVGIQTVGSIVQYFSGGVAFTMPIPYASGILFDIDLSSGGSASVTIQAILRTGSVPGAGTQVGNTQLLTYASGVSGFQTIDFYL